MTRRFEPNGTMRTSTAVRCTPRFRMSSTRTLARTERYGSVAIGFHWLLAVMIVGSLGVGLYMSDLPMSPTRLKLFNWHKWAGITIMTLSGLRLLWRLTHRPPPDVAMPRWQRVAAHATHWALYALFFLTPLAGWAYSSAPGFPVVVFGGLPLPGFGPGAKAPAET